MHKEACQFQSTGEIPVHRPELPSSENYHFAVVALLGDSLTQRRVYVKFVSIALVDECIKGHSYLNGYTGVFVPVYYTYSGRPNLHHCPNGLVSLLNLS